MIWGENPPFKETPHILQFNLPRYTPLKINMDHDIIMEVWKIIFLSKMDDLGGKPTI